MEGLTRTPAGSIVAETPAAIEFMRLAVLKGALKLETLGMRRRGRPASALVREALRAAGQPAPRDKTKLLEVFTEYLKTTYS